MIHFFAACADGKIHDHPDHKINDDEDRGEDEKHHRLEGDPCIDEITDDIGEIKRSKMAEERFGKRPLLDLIKDAGARMDKC